MQDDDGTRADHVMMRCAVCGGGVMGDSVMVGADGVVLSWYDAVIDAVMVMA